MRRRRTPLNGPGDRRVMRGSYMGFTTVRRLLAAATTVGLLAVPAAMTVTTPIQNMVESFGCEYPDSAATKTTLDLANSVGEYGEPNSATATVTSGVGTPTGDVAFRLDGRTYVRRLSGGTATFQFPTLDAGETYRVRVYYRGDCGFKKSSSPYKNYTVLKASIYADAVVVDGRRAIFSATFTNRNGDPAPDGRAAFSVSKNGDTIRYGEAAVRGGTATVDRGDLGGGTYQLEVVYLGSSNFTGVPDYVTFEVARSRR